MSRIACVLAMSALAFGGCGEKAAPVVQESAKPVVVASSSGSASAASVEPPPPPPTLVLREMFAGEVKGYAGVFRVADALVVGDGKRVGKIVGEKIEWIQAIPEGGGMFGPTELTWVGGKSLDAIDIFYRFANGRAPAPTYSPLTGKGYDLRFAPGGGWGFIHGAAYVGESLVLQGSDMADGQRIQTARGPRIERFTIPASSQGCKQDVFPKPAIDGWTFGATGNGTLISAGTHCLDEMPALEVWGPTDTKSKIVKLDTWLPKKGTNFSQVLTAGPESAWIVTRSGDVLSYDKGTITALPKLEGRDLVWLGTDGALYAASTTGAHKLVEGRWELLGRFSWDYGFSTAVTHEGKIWASSAGTVFRLEPGTSTELTDDCKTPFVRMYDVSPESEPTFTFPATRKALSTFDKVAEIELVEFVESRRRLGITVPSRAVGEAVIAHVKANMKDEKPSLICYVPKTKRVIAIKAGK